MKPGEKLDKESVDVTHMWFMLLGSVTSTLAVLSVLPNYALAFILTRSKRTNAVLFTLRSCVCADIMTGSLFLVFVFPSWIRGDRLFGNIACSIGGMLITWSGLVLPYSLVFMTFQRYSLTKRICGWSVMKDRFRLFNVTIWIFAGLVTALPFTESNTAYTYNTRVCYCALNGRQRSMVYDHLGYLLPGILLFLAGICLNSIKTKNKKGHEIQNSRGYHTNDYHPTNQCYILSSKREAFETRRVEAETRISFTHIAFVSSLLALGSYAFRTYGNWNDPGNCAVQAASFLLTFADGISRSMTIFMVRKVMQKTLKDRELKNFQKLCSASILSKTSTRSSYGFTSVDTMVRNRAHPHGRRSSGFTSFSLSAISARSTYRKFDRMSSFWSDTSCTPKSSVSSSNGCPRWSKYDPEMTWQTKVTRTIRDYKRQNYDKTVKIQQSLRKRRTRKTITRHTELASRGNSANRPLDLYHIYYSSGENYHRGKFRPNPPRSRSRCNVSKAGNDVFWFREYTNRTQCYKTRCKGTRRNSRFSNDKQRNCAPQYAYGRQRALKSTARSNRQLVASLQPALQVSSREGNVTLSGRRRDGHREYLPDQNQPSRPRPTAY